MINAGYILQILYPSRPAVSHRRLLWRFGTCLLALSLDGWMEFISPGGTEPKGPRHANYIRFIRFSHDLAQAL